LIVLPILKWHFPADVSHSRSAPTRRITHRHRRFTSPLLFAALKGLFDILGLGCTAVDDLLYVPTSPRPDDKVEVRARERHCGGLTATALVAAARLGARCAYAGTLGRDDGSCFVLETLKGEGINVRHVVRRDQARPVRSVVVVDEARGTRTIFYDTKQVFGADPNRPRPDLIRSTRVLLVDRFGIPGMIRAARLARSAGLPVVADFESSHLPRFRELLALADHLILSGNFACELTGTKSPATAARKLWRKGRRVVITTCGAQGCWFVDGPDRNAHHFPACRVTAVDTTGCGDVFHGAYAFALARGLPVLGRIRLASAAAALKATHRGGQAGIPTLAAVKTFLQHHRP
jgi:sugar/nucleoside kinase (ribokinase family)